MPAARNDAATRAVCATVIPFFISASSRSDAASNPALTATQPEAASSRQRSGVKASSKRIFPHQVIVVPRSSSASARSFNPCGGAASSTK